MVRASSLVLISVKTVKDLKGKKVGVTRGIQDILLAAELSQNGLTYSDQPGKDVQIIYLGFPDLNQALLGKNIDAMMQSEPYSSQSIGKGFGKEVIKPYDTPLGEPVRAMVMTEKFYKERRPVAEKFMRCFVEATKPSSTTKIWLKNMCAKVCSKVRSATKTL
jgi:NitT/TauT family transport system substrate-binding protein